MYIWLDESIIHQHVGVRRTIINLRNILRQHGVKITFLLQERLMQQKGLVRQITFSEYWLSNNGMGFSADYEADGAPFQEIITLNHLSDLDVATHILSAPWLVQDFQEVPLLQKYSLMVFLPDLIPLQYSLEGVFESDSWVLSHSAVVEMAARNQLKLLVCSYQVAIEVQNLMPANDFLGNIIVIHPGVYVEHLKSFDLNETENERQQILMLNILDRRKGMLKAKEFVMSLPAKEKICIIGHSRCSPDDLASFLKVMRKHKYRWLKNVSTNEVVKEFNNSKFLLFPSKHEGYGIPAIEANYFGVPVLTHSNLPVWENLAFKIDLESECLPKFYSSADFVIPENSEVLKFRSELNVGLNHWVNRNFISS